MTRESWQSALAGGRALPGLKLAFMAVGSATNRRSMVATLLRDVPCGNSVPVLQPAAGARAALAVAACLNSLTYDFALRARLGGLNLNHFVIAETALLRPAAVTPGLLRCVAKLALAHPCFAPSWLELGAEDPSMALPPSRWAWSEHERLRLRCMIDAIVARGYGLSRSDFAAILLDCDHPRARLATPGFTRRLDAKAFWRVDGQRDPELRHPLLSMVAFDDLARRIAAAGDEPEGIASFCDEERGWQLPEHVCVAELGLPRSVELGEYDERARELVPVRCRVGPRVLDEQRGHGWAEVAAHAEALAKQWGPESNRLSPP